MRPVTTVNEPPSDAGKGVVWAAEVDARNPPVCASMVIAKSAYFQHIEPARWHSCCGWRFGQCSTLVDRSVLYQDARLLIGDQFNHAFDRDLLLFVVTNKHAPCRGQARRKPEVVHKEREVADSERLCGHCLSRKQQRNADAEGDGIIADRPKEFTNQE